MKKFTIIILVSMTGLLSTADLFTPSVEMGVWPDENLIIARTEASGGETAGVWLQIETADTFNSILRPNDGTVSIGQSWYEVMENAVIDAEFVSTAPLFYDNRGSLGGEIEIIHNQPFIMAFWLDGTVLGGATNVYGWAELVYDGANLTLLDSAAENSGVGIVAGKYEAVPEPATALLFGIGAIGAWLVRKNKRHSGPEDFSSVL